MLRFLWGAITASTLFLVFVGSNNSTAPNPEASFPKIAPYLALGAALLSFAIPKFLLSEKKIQRWLERAQQTFAAQFKAGGDEHLRVVFTAYLIFPLLLSLSLNEVVAVLGLLASFTSGVPTEMYPYAIVATVLNLLHFPSSSKLEEQFEQIREVSRGMARHSETSSAGNASKH